MIKYLLILIIALSLSHSNSGEVVMCYSDTADTEMAYTGDDGEEYEFTGKDDGVYWQKGYLINGKFYDSNRAELSKSIIIWAYK